MAYKRSRSTCIALLILKLRTWYRCVISFPPAATITPQKHPAKMKLSKPQSQYRCLGDEKKTVVPARTRSLDHPTFPPHSSDQTEKSKVIPGQFLRVRTGWGYQISRQLPHEGGKVVSPTHRPPLSPQEIFLVLIYVRGRVDPRVIVWPEGLCQWKLPMP